MDWSSTFLYCLLSIDNRNFWLQNGRNIGENALKTITEAVECHKNCEQEKNTLKREIIDNNTEKMRDEMATKFEALKITSGQIIKEELDPNFRFLCV